MPKIVKLPVHVVIASLLVSAAAAQPERQGPPNEEGQRGPRPMVFVSPAGLPFRAEPGVPQDVPPPERWFSTADKDASGTLTRDEFRDDFKAAFAVFDSDGDGIINHLEVSNYEEQIFPEIRTASASGGRQGGGGGRPSGGRGGGPGGGGGPPGGGGSKGPGGGGQGGSESRSGGSGSQNYDPSAIGAARFGLLPIPHPLLDADPQMRRKISLDDYLDKADERFALLDDLNQGFLAHDALMEKLPKRPERGKGKRSKN